jgi:citrate lyase beta subunit
VKGRRLVTTDELAEARWILEAAAQAGEGAEIVDAETGQVIERHPAKRG